MARRDLAQNERRTSARSPHTSPSQWDTVCSHSEGTSEALAPGRTCCEGLGVLTRQEEAELKVIADVVEVYETVRWPVGKEPEGKGYIGKPDEESRRTR
jgi:hypothetical protein